MLSVVATQVKTVQDCIKKLAIVANREPQYQHLPPGLPPVTIGNFMFEGDLVRFAFLIVLMNVPYRSHLHSIDFFDSHLRFLYYDEPGLRWSH